MKKGFSNETIHKTVKALKNAIAYFMQQMESGVKLLVTISKGNKKIGRVWNLSTAPAITCGNCSACIRFCYAIRDIFKFGYDFLKNCILRSRAKNTAILLFDRSEFFRQIDTFCSSNRKVKIFRWHVSGEILDDDYFYRMCDIAIKHPDWIFWSYTKMFSCVNHYFEKHSGRLPKNLHVMFSRWMQEEIDNPFGMPEFHTVEEVPAGAENVCCGNCQFCLDNKTGCPYGVGMYCKLH